MWLVLLVVIEIAQKVKEFEVCLLLLLLAIVKENVENRWNWLNVENGFLYDVIRWVDNK